MNFDWFTVARAYDLRRSMDMIPDASGVYMLLLPAGTVLTLAEYGGPPPLFLQGHQVVYIGSSSRLRRRLKNHLVGASYVSSFRMTVGMILAAQLGLTGQHSGPLAAFWFTPEEALTEWLDKNMLVAFAPCDDAPSVEVALLAAQPSPLNITFRKDSKFGRRLLEMRAAYRRRCAS